MKTFLLCALMLCAIATRADNYYFSSVSGDDSRTAAQAKNPATPWKTLSKLNSFFNSLASGDSVLLKRGQTFYGSIKLNRSSRTTSPVVIGAYGTGNKPVITSLVTLVDWVSKGNGIYESYNSALGSTLNMVLLNGVQQQIGRYPNYDAATGGYLYFESHSGRNSITDKELTSATNWTGAELVIRQRHWIINRVAILSHSGSTIKHEGTSGEPFDGYGYFIQNSIKTLDKSGEWYYNPSTKKVSVYFGSASPSSYVIEATTIQDLIYTENTNNVTFTDLSIKGANGDGFNIVDGSNMTVKNCDVLFSGVDAVDLAYHTNFTIENCNISNSNNNGIDVGYGENSTVRNNKVINTSNIAGMGLSGDGSGIGIGSRGNNSLVEFNEVRNTGYIGISFAGNNSIVKNNLVDTYCSVKDDGAGIYTSADDQYGRKIIANIVMNGIGAGNGTNIVTTNTAQGIYLDNNTNDAEVRNNTVVNTARGLYLHNTANIIVNNNTFYNNNQQVYMNQDPNYNLTRGNTITNNIIFSKRPSSTLSIFKSNKDDVNLFGRLDSNYYARPLNDGLIISNIYTTASGAVSESLDLKGWQDKYNKDGKSKKSPKSIAPYKLNKLTGLNTVANGKFTTDTKGVGSSSVTISLNSSQLDGNCLQVVPSAKGGTLSFAVGAITAGKNYILRYTTKSASESDMVIGAYLRQAASPYDALSSTQSNKVSSSRTANEIMFAPLSSQNAAKIVFKIADVSKFYLDNLEFYEADATITNPDDSIRFEYNATNVTRTVILDGNYIDVRNKSYSNSITLPPYATAVLLKTGGGSNQNAAPTVSVTGPAADADFTAPASIAISATATDADGSVSKVEFFNGNTLLGTDNASPYSFTWSNVAPGNYNLTVKATDNDGATSSDAVSVSVTKTTISPVVKINSPSANADFTAPASVNISASATDSDGSISKVEFYNGNTLLGSDNTSPYTYNWSNVATGSYTLTVKATDNDGLTSSDAVSVTVVKTNEVPTVTLTSPLADANFTAPASISINAAATDADGSISKVEFYNGNTLLGTDYTSPYAFKWNNVAQGNYNLTVKATDNGGLTASDAIVVSVVKNTVQPVVSITSPSVNANFTAPASITISATASDSDGSISKVEFYNGNTLIGTQNSSPYIITWNNVAPGNYNLTAKATDNDGLISTDAITVSVVRSAIEPVISITSPSTNASFNGPVSINITATATDADGSISTIEFYNGNTLIGGDNTSPYAFVWSNVAPGNYNLTVKATDNDGLTSSAAVTVSVIKLNEAPAVSITSPSVDATFNAPASVIINASASDADGSIATVEFFNGNTFLSADNTSPYTFTWSNVAAGNYAITAKATDNGGLVTSSSAVTVTVIRVNEAPIVSLTSPSADASFIAPASVHINADAADADGSITKVEFYNGNTLVGTKYNSPYNFTLRNIGAGTYAFTAKAFDNSGLSASSAAVTVSVIRSVVAPVVSITSPSVDASFNAPASISINATATDADGSIAKVEFYNGNTFLSSDSTSPYAFTWSNVAAGNYALTAKATDNDGLVTSSSSVTISVIRINNVPAVSLTIPFSDSSFIAPASIHLNATAADVDGSITKVEFYNGNTLVGTKYNSPYTFTSRNNTAGTYAFTAKAFDNSGLSASSAAVTVLVIKSVIVPVVSVTSSFVDSSFNTPVSVSINATATDADGSIAKVEFFNGNTLLGTDDTAPYTFEWNDVAAGSYIVMARATDNDGLISADTASFSVPELNVAPTVSITSPSDNISFTSSARGSGSAAVITSSATGFTSPAAITIHATAADADGSIAKVDFYNGSTLLGSDKTIPYTFVWSNVAEGNYNLTAKATDNEGLVTSSSTVAISVDAPQTAPTITITSPVNMQIASGPATIRIQASASDADGSISKVEFYNGAELLGVEFLLPYSTLWKNVAPGDYTITAKAYDNDGFATTSASVFISVKVNTPPIVNITTDVTHYSGPASITLSADASDSNGTIRKVEFYNGTTLLRTENYSRYRWNWKDVAIGTYIITAKAYDNNGSSTVSEPVTIVVSSLQDFEVSNTSAAPAKGELSRSSKMASDSPSVITNNSRSVNNSQVMVSGKNSSNIEDDHLKILKIKIGPNPTSNILSVFTNGLQKNEELKISVRSVSGTLLKTLTSNTNNRVIQVDVSSLKNGFYILSLMGKDVSISEKFEKQ